MTRLLPNKIAHWIGKSAEASALHFLEQRGLTLVEKNYRCRGGEIDLVMKDKDYFVFVEVKGRARSEYGHPFEHITPTKQRRLTLAAKHYINSRFNTLCVNMRFDGVAVHLNDKKNANSIEWIKNIILN